MSRVKTIIIFISLFYFISNIPIARLLDEDVAPMNYIIDNIYLGGILAAENEHYLDQYNIGFVVNCAEEIHIKYKKRQVYALNLEDTETQKIFPIFELAYRIIKKFRNRNILVHCAAGMSRSASLVIFYLMKEKGWNYDQCFKYVKERRSVISPNDGFEKQLRDYYEKHFKNGN